jgi:hypothetical protein
MRKLSHAEVSYNSVIYEGDDVVNLTAQPENQRYILDWRDLTANIV